MEENIENIDLEDLENKLNYYTNSLSEYTNRIGDIMKMEEGERNEHIAQIYKLSGEMDGIISSLVKKSKIET